MRTRELLRAMRAFQSPFEPRMRSPAEASCGTVKVVEESDPDPDPGSGGVDIPDTDSPIVLAGGGALLLLIVVLALR